MKNYNNIENVFFIGIGGIGMSALARYFQSSGYRVAGYDRTSSSLTGQLQSEGMEIHFEDNIDLIPQVFLNVKNTMVIYTPAIPKDHSEYIYFREKGFKLMKRSEMLGEIAKGKKCIAVAGTHGKTTISSMLAWIISNSDLKCNAFLGGISKNTNSNFMINPGSEIVVVEADEFDRSFLHLKPEIALITAVDPDHLDIYGNLNNLKENFALFVSGLKQKGKLLLKNGVELPLREDLFVKRYSLNTTSDYFAGNIHRDGFSYSFDLFTPDGIISNLKLGIYGLINLENAVAAIALCDMAGINENIIRTSINTYKGVFRRFDVQIESERLIYIDDYAHHPEELRAFISSVREATPGKRVSGIFQPHLYSRTKDLADGFALELSKLDDVILLDIYPAREEPIPGVTSNIIFEKLTNPGERKYCSKEELSKVLQKLETDVWLSMGAGDIDKLVPLIKKTLLKKL